MKLFKSLLLSLFLLFSFVANAAETFTIYAGDKKATFYKVANSICQVFNQNNENYKCKAVPAKGAIDNLYKLANQEADFAVIKTPNQNIKFLGTKKALPLIKNIDPIIRIHDEFLTILVRKNQEIKNLQDLSDKIVSTGSIGSSSKEMVEKYFVKEKIAPKKVYNLGAGKSFEMICKGKIDAWAYFIGHPNHHYQNTLENCNVEFLSLSHKEKRSLKESFNFLTNARLKKGFYNSLNSNIYTLASPTIIAASKNVTPELKKLLIDTVLNKNQELIKEDKIFEFIICNKYKTWFSTNSQSLIFDPSP